MIKFAQGGGHCKEAVKLSKGKTGYTSYPQVRDVNQPIIKSLNLTSMHILG